MCADIECNAMSDCDIELMSLSQSSKCDPDFEVPTSSQSSGGGSSFSENIGVKWNISFKSFSD